MSPLPFLVRSTHSLSPFNIPLTPYSERDHFRMGIEETRECPCPVLSIPKMKFPDIELITCYFIICLISLIFNYFVLNEHADSASFILFVLPKACLLLNILLYLYSVLKRI